MTGFRRVEQLGVNIDKDCAFLAKSVKFGVGEVQYMYFHLRGY